MTYEQMTSLDNVVESHTIGGVLTHIFRFGGNIGWWTSIEDKTYGNFVEERGDWKKGTETISAVEAMKLNAESSIKLIKKV